MAQIKTSPRIGIANSRAFYRIFEIIPGFLTWFILLSPVVFSLFWPILVAYFIIAFDLFWLLKSIRMSFALIMGYRRTRETEAIDWSGRLSELADVDGAIATLQKELASTKYNRHHIEAEIARLEQIQKHSLTLMKPSDIYQCIIMPVVSEPIEIVKPSIEAILRSDYPADKIIFVLAYEQRGGEGTREMAQKLESEFKSKFHTYLTIEHPDGIPGEIKGKGPNITFAGREVLKFVRKEGIPENDVIVTTLDCDHRMHKLYLSRLTYAYCINPNRLHSSFQPLALFFNNIWDVPAPMRVIATGNSFWVMIESVRPHRLRNFASHSQGLASLVDTDFWSLTSPVEDGHQYYRTYFTYNGDHMVEPLFLPIYQDAVLASNHHRTFIAQFKQLQRWAYGISDFPYVVKNSVLNKEIPWSQKLLQIGRLLEGHISWSTAPLILTFAAWAPLYLNSTFNRQVVAHQLPVVASRILTLATIGLIVSIWISLIMMPKRPAHQPRWKIISVVLQWLLVPITAIVFGAFAAISAQTRLMLGRYLGFYVTEKSVTTRVDKKADK